MKNRGLLNADIIREIAAAGHTQMIAIGDAGLPIPCGVRRIDLSVVQGVPAFADVLGAVCNELVVEAYTYAEEAGPENPEVVKVMTEMMPGIPGRTVAHEDFKILLQRANVVIRTGECSPYANVILTAGVNF
ncbi:MAG: D-ribose pyranase [Oscillospiraceae bacterium]|nr:D-ribose pyranase [Oscillospiraceae bacterium]